MPRTESISQAPLPIGELHKLKKWRRCATVLAPVILVFSGCGPMDRLRPTPADAPDGAIPIMRVYPSNGLNLYASIQEGLTREELGGFCEFFGGKFSTNDERGKGRNETCDTPEWREEFISSHDEPIEGDDGQNRVEVVGQFCVNSGGIFTKLDINAPVRIPDGGLSHVYCVMSAPTSG